MFRRKKYHGKVFTTHKKRTKIGYATYSGERYVYPRSAKAGHNKRGDNKRWAAKMRWMHGQD